MLQGDSPVIYGDGEQTTDFIYVDDVVKANLLANSTRDISGEVFNVASGESLSVNQLLKILNQVLETNLEPEYQAERKGDVRHSSASIEKARNMLGFVPSVTFEKRLRKTWNSMQCR